MPPSVRTELYMILQAHWLTYTLAMRYYKLSNSELGMLKYEEFDNQHNLKQPGHSYNHTAVERMVYRRCAAQAGDENATQEYDTGTAEELSMLKRGKDIWTAQ